MFKEKNLSPRQLALFTALVLSIPIGLGFFAYGGHSWKEATVAFVLILAGSYGLISYIFQRFIYRKLKLIYKFIYQTKASKKQETYYKYILPQKSIDEVRQDVEAWGKQRRREIELLKRNETFRKEFLQNLSHEFKTPVFAIQGYIETLLQGAVEDRAITERFLQKAQKNVERLSHLIQDLDEISRLERGELKLHPGSFIIQDLVREVFESLSLLAEPQHIALQIKKGCEAPIAVWADKEKIRQVLINLVENAIKYGRANGSVTASMYNTDGKNILVEISDDGMGIPEGSLSRIFERFYRTPEGRGRDVTGSGLGLSICKHIIEAHGHAIHVRSTEGVGTTIGFTLAARKA
ncbi:sensor histidine kinase [Flaviaesturariibacter flavus]|uniref:histidine kinase n=1 Tax=Flaviaesturariibacter flavus TaxID=2502780 RepID=A0A4R1BMY1_9BACT|nr:ATP-binding protein [Flaviaesturariibacter flavus]TCJ18799.1 sensor histidine kinase [Flaviaesturariibacter flavus]